MDMKSIPVKHTKPNIKISNENKDSSSEDEAEVIEEPTLELIQQSEKPEFQYTVKSGRSKKKEKHEKLLEVKKTISKDKDIIKNIEYLKKWKYNRNNWKFEKLRQISINTSIFNENKIDDKIFEIALEYLSGSKGKAKTCLIEMAEKEINKIDDEIEKINDNNLVNSAPYKRAREILQSFD